MGVRSSPAPPLNKIMDEQMKKEVPSWVQEKQELQVQESEELVFVGATETKVITDGKLPNGDPYLWKKRRN